MMEWRSLSAAAFALALLALDARASGPADIECRAAVSSSERVICASPSLRAADTKLSRDYATVRRAVSPRSLADALIASQRAWLAARDRDCATSACLEARIAERDAVLSALAARVSDDNPTLLDLTAVWIEGAWVAGPVSPPGIVPSATLPRDGAVVSFKPSAICVAQNCAGLGLEPATLASVSKTLPPLLGLPSASPLYGVLINGKAAYDLAPLSSGALVAVTDGCDPSGHACTFVRQTWRPAGPGNVVHQQSAVALPKR